ncbi:hypothetical protein L873DRAFT_1316661 [Choiromyces venosus 120613-1]|uniref:Rhodopsin domain-containing protein n=1 Tax=Choiromyces venosus 120613-1 TaxID=1336337 RepID=A0A3N4JAR6_9PEZI|nr:hypothetical protein L873DRAFT_1316661 [Choiromyces venosus 120613-1]
MSIRNAGADSHVEHCLRGGSDSVRRLFVRLRMLRSGGRDDFAFVMATTLLTANAILTCVASKYRFGMYIWDIKPDIAMALGITRLYNPSMLAVKLSILPFYKRIFSSKTFGKVLPGTGLFVTAIAITFTLANLLRRQPAAYYWGRAIPNLKCIKSECAILYQCCVEHFHRLADLGAATTAFEEVGVASEGEDSAGVYLLVGGFCHPLYQYQCYTFRNFDLRSETHSREMFILLQIHTVIMSGHLWYTIPTLPIAVYSVISFYSIWGLWLS